MVERKPDVPAEVEAEIERRSDELQAALAAGDLASAQAAAQAAWDAIPEPRSQWEFYPAVLPRDFADLFVRAGAVEHAKAWLAVAMESKPARIGENVPLDLVAARVHVAMGDRDTAERIAGTLLEMHGRRPFTGGDEDLLPFAKAHRSRGAETTETAAEAEAEAEAEDEPDDVALPSADGGAATQRPDLDDEIERLSEAGNRAAEDEDWTGAIRRWTRALELVPAPRSEWSASTWLYTSIGDAHYLAGRLDEAMEAFGAALKCPDAFESAFLWLRLGQALVDQGHVEPGVRSLTSAYMLAGEEIFEQEDPRFRRLLGEHVDLEALLEETEDVKDVEDVEEAAPPAPPSGAGASRPAPTNAEWKALAERTGSRFEALFADADGFLGAAGMRLLRSALDAPSLRGENRVRDLTALLVLADMAGRGDVLRAGAEILREVPFTGNMTIYEPIRQTFCGAFRRSLRDGENGEPFASLIEIPAPGLADEERRGRGDLLRQRADGLLLVPPSESAAASAARPAAHHVLNTCMAVQELYLMWAFGGGRTWTRARIDAEIDAAAGILRRLRAIA